MNDRETRRYQTFKRVREFGLTYSAAFPLSTLGGQLFDVVGKSADELTEHAAAQFSGNTTFRQSTSTKATLREELRDNLVAISRTARSISTDKSNVEDKFRLPRNSNDQLLLNAAVAFAKDAAPLAEEFVRHEMPTDFLEELNRNIALFEKAVNEQTHGTATQVGATAAIDKAVERGTTAVRKLDAIVRNKLRDDSSALTIWASASHTERAPSAAPVKAPPDVPKS